MVVDSSYNYFCWTKLKTYTKIIYTNLHIWGSSSLCKQFKNFLSIKYIGPREGGLIVHEKKRQRDDLKNNGLLYCLIIDFYQNIKKNPHQ